MKVVIEISEEKWQRVLDGTSCFPKEIYDGVPLPMGHGDLIDRNEVLKNMDYEADGYCDWDCYKPITEAKTIIEADRSE